MAWLANIDNSKNSSFVCIGIKFKSDAETWVFLQERDWVTIVAWETWKGASQWRLTEVSGALKGSFYGYYSDSNITGVDASVWFQLNVIMCLPSYYSLCSQSAI